jgi:hypothetical protein
MDLEEVRRWIDRSDFCYSGSARFHWEKKKLPHTSQPKVTFWSRSPKPDERHPEAAKTGLTSCISSPEPKEQALVPISNTILVRHQGLDANAPAPPSTFLNAQTMMAGVSVAALLVCSFGTSVFATGMRRRDLVQQQVLEVMTAAIRSQDHNVANKDEDLKQLVRSSGETLSRLDLVRQNIGARNDVEQRLNDRLNRLERMLGSTPAPAVSVVSAAESPTRRDYAMDKTIPPIANASLHYNSDKEADYWLVQREVRPNSDIVVRVVPFATSRLGVMVHSLDDGRNYILTSTGGWMSNE